MKILIKIILNAAVLYGISYIIPGIDIENFVTAIFAVIVISLINLVVKPVLGILTLPINILTLGLLGLFLNVLLFMLASNLVDGFYISNLFSAAIGLVLYSIFQAFIGNLE